LELRIILDDPVAFNSKISAHPIGNVRRVRRLGFGHEIGDFGLQLRLDLARMFIGKRAVPARVGVDFRAVEPDRPHFQYAHLARQQQHLNEQRLAERAQDGQIGDELHLPIPTPTCEPTPSL
jgi:hypothetical protein